MGSCGNHAELDGNRRESRRTYSQPSTRPGYPPNTGARRPGRWDFSTIDHVNLLEQMLDSRCVGCSTWGDIVCTTCLARCGDSPVRGTTSRGIATIALGEYRGTLRSLVLAAKHRGARAVVRRLGGELRHIALPFAPAVAIPIPSSVPGFRARGYGLAAIVANLCDLPVVDCLRLMDEGTQRGRRRDERQLRRMSITAQRPPVGTRVIIVDDVVTTGASIDAAADACHAAGLRVVGAIAIADASRSTHRGRPT